MAQQVPIAAQACDHVSAGRYFCDVWLPKTSDEPTNRQPPTDSPSFATNAFLEGSDSISQRQADIAFPLPKGQISYVNVQGVSETQPRNETRAFCLPRLHLTYSAFGDAHHVSECAWRQIGIQS